MSAKKCLVTGAGGFLGVELTKQLLERGFSVRALLKHDESEDHLKGFIYSDIQRGDILNKEDAKKAVEGMDYVFHTASLYEATPFYIKSPSQIYATNIEGVRNICEASLEQGIKKVIYTGSTAAVGKRDDGQASDETIELNFLEKRSHYEKSKAMGEKEALSFHQKGLFVTAIDPSFMIGAGDKRPTPTGDIILKFLNRQFPCYFEGVICLSDLTSVAKAHIDALDTAKSGERYIVVMDKPYSLKELFQTLEKVSGVKAPFLKLPLNVLIFFSMINEAILGLLGLSKKIKPLIPFETARYFTLSAKYSASKAEKELNYKSHSLEEALKQSVNWYRDHGFVKA